MKQILLTISIISFLVCNAKLYNTKYSEQNKNIKDAPCAVFIGNSITHNWAKFDTAFFVKHNFIGRGISGETSIEILSRFNSDVVSLKPKITVIMCGTNDIAENRGIVSDNHIIGNIRKMVEVAKKNGISPILCSITPCNYYKWRKDLKPAKRIIRINSMIKRYAEANGIPYVDYHSVLSDSEGALPEKYTIDGCHPNLECYKIMEETVLNVINRIKTE